jgi:hypothetical protein
MRTRAESTQLEGDANHIGDASVTIATASAPKSKERSMSARPCVSGADTVQLLFHSFLSTWRALENGDMCAAFAVLI